MFDFVSLCVLFICVDFVLCVDIDDFVDCVE